MFEKLRRWRGAELRILAYHRIVDPRPDFEFDLEVVSASVEQFERQMRLLKRHFHPLRLGDAVSMMDAGKSLPKGAVVITFDDGYDDNYRVAFPVLRELDIPATFFVSTGYIDNGLPYAYDWFVHMLLRTDATQVELAQLGIVEAIPTHRSDRRALADKMLSRMKALQAHVQEEMIEQLGVQWNMPRERSHPDCRPMTWEQLREMHAAGMEIGSHGVHHRMLAKLPSAELRAELEGSKASLDRELETSATTLSYPVGGYESFNPDVVRACEMSGFRAACTYLPGTNPWPAKSMFELRRLAVERNMDEAWFAAMLTSPGVFCYPEQVPDEP